ncbi:MAG: hypothetical protein OXM56_05680 [Gammaproteobacteria bacterium]|nr:hypothetical protein [Gammaproteobacteria bacterium]
MIDAKLTDAEDAMLEDAGVDLDEGLNDTDPMLDYDTEFADIQANSLTLETLARTLGMTPERVRQMICERALYAFRVDGKVYVPIHQIVGQTLLPDIAQVNQAIAHLDPVSVQRWLTTADPDLADMTPLDWLRAEREVSAVLQVAPER